MNLLNGVVILRVFLACQVIVLDFYLQEETKMHSTYRKFRSMKYPPQL